MSKRLVPTSTREIMVLEDQYDSGLYGKRPVALVKGQGARLWDAEGKEYIDCIGGHGVANVGHSQPAIDICGRLIPLPATAASWFSVS